MPIPNTENGPCGMVLEKHFFSEREVNKARNTGLH